MAPASMPQYDPRLDLWFERVVAVPREKIWRAWTDPALLKTWFAPAPWVTTDCAIDLRPGGMFRTTMRSPEGQDFPHSCSYLEIIPNERLVWTNMLSPGYRPAAVPSGVGRDMFMFTAVIALAPQGADTRYTAHVMHGDAESRNKHETMGFQEGWGKALDQLVVTVGKV